MEFHGKEVKPKFLDEVDLVFLEDMEVHAILCIVMTCTPGWVEQASVQVMDESLIRQLNARSHGFVAGDVLLANQEIQLGIKAVMDRGEPGRMGRVTVLGPFRDSEPYRFESGPVNNWNRGEMGSNGNLAAVRFTQQSEQWSTTLVFQLARRSSWVDVSTTIMNLSNRRLEIPVVDVVRGPADARLAREGPIIAIGRADLPTLAVIPTGGPLIAEQPVRSEWFVAHLSRDEGPGKWSRIKNQILHFGKAQLLSPVTPDRLWNAEMKDRSHWHRMEPGHSVTVHRRIIVSGRGQDMRSLLTESLRHPPPAVNLVSVETGSPVPKQLFQPKSIAKKAPKTEQRTQPQIFESRDGVADILKLPSPIK
jgi:hypothetical protein